MNSERTDATAKRKECHRLLRLGWSNAEVVSRLQLSRSLVTRERARQGIEGRIKINDSVLAKAKLLAQESRPADVIIAETDCPPRYVRQFVKEANRLRAALATKATQFPCPFGLFRDASGNQVFLPSPAMWHLHNASLLTAVASRAGIRLDDYYRWQRDFGSNHWIFGWLRGDKAPTGIELKYPSEIGYLRRGPRAGEVFITPEMLAFREQAKPIAVEAAARESDPETAVNRGHWVRRFPALKAWMMRGDDPPLVVLSESAVQRLVNAWHVPSLLNECGVTPKSYDDALAKRFPSDDFPVWVAWLFGGSVPSGWFIIPERVFSLKQRLMTAGRCKAAQISHSSVKRWNREKGAREALSEVLETVRKGGNKPLRESPFWTFDARTRDAMFKLAKASTFEAALADVGLSGSSWKECRDKATRDCGTEAAQFLEDYVHGRLPETTWRTSDKRGVLAPGLFLPPTWMKDFRDAALTLRRNERLSELEPGERKVASSRVLPSRELFLRLLCAFVLPPRVADRLSFDKQTKPPDNVNGSNGEQRTHAPSAGDSQAETKTTRVNASRLFVGEVPSNTDLVDLVLQLDVQRNSGKSWNQIAIAFKKGNKSEASSLLSQVRRYIRKGRLLLKAD